MTGNGFNIAGKSKTLKPEQRHNRAFDGVKIAMRSSKKVKNALKKTKGDEAGNEVKKLVKETIEAATVLKENTKKDVFEKLN